MMFNIIPTYNEAAHLESTLQHLLSLREHPVEIIVADGDSTGNTVVVATQYQADDVALQCIL
jgi:glycosyltransferase involved in cell wall biosynthesis